MEKNKTRRSFERNKGRSFDYKISDIWIYKSFDFFEGNCLFWNLVVGFKRSVKMFQKTFEVLQAIDDLATEYYEKIKTDCDTYEDLAVVCYINSTAELKQHSDVCVTSANAVKIVKALPNKNIFFIPDNNLAHYVAEQVPEKHFVFNKGFCPVHENMCLEEVLKAKEEHPETEVLTHPECPEAICKISDYIGSTSGIIRYAGTSEKKEFIICTESGVRFQLEKENPDKKFYFTKTEPVCRDMKLVTLEKIAHVLETGENEVHVTEKLRIESEKALSKMLELAK